MLFTPETYTNKVELLNSYKFDSHSDSVVIVDGNPIEIFGFVGDTAYEAVYTTKEYTATSSGDKELITWCVAGGAFATRRPDGSLDVW